jgi:hypothetical protein
VAQGSVHIEYKRSGETNVVQARASPHTVIMAPHSTFYIIYFTNGANTID